MHGLLSRFVVFTCLAGAFFVSVFSLPTVFFHFTRVLPDNYRYLADQALRHDHFASAEALARRRINQFCYDFDAHYLLGEALAREGKPAEAVQVMKQVLAKVPATRGRKVNAVGYDEARTLFQLSNYLWQDKRYFEAGEMARAALDAGTPILAQETFERMGKLPQDPQAALAAARVALKMGHKELFDKAQQKLAGSDSSSRAQATLLQAAWYEQVDHQSTAALRLLSSAAEQAPRELQLQAGLRDLLERVRAHDKAQKLTSLLESTTGTRLVAPGLFELPSGDSATTECLELGRNGMASAQINTGVFKQTSILFHARGSRALGLYPMVAVKSADKELCWLYLDAPRGKVYNLQLWPAGAPKSLDLRFDFMNDAYDPVTKADRNASLSHIMLH